MPELGKMAMNNKDLMDLAIDLAARQVPPENSIQAAGATCPMPDCGALAIAYEAPDSLREVCRSFTASWDFVCSACGAEFMAPEKDLLFQAIPRDWLRAQVCRA